MSLLENSLENVLKNNSIDSSQFISKIVKVSSYPENKDIKWKYYNNLNEVFVQKNTKIFLKICDTLIKNKALLSGGSVLGSFSEFENDNLDLDIYVNKKNSYKIYKDLKNIGYNIVENVCLAPAYDQSFFRKNHILCRFRLLNNNFLPIDLMIIPDDISLLSVVTNFDLSFCEIWFDGQNVYAVDPEGIKNKEGKLKPEYNESLFKYFNKFIIKRIEKYGKRGFKISYSSPFSRCTFLGKKEEIKDITIPNGTIRLLNETTNRYVYPEEWAVKLVLNKFYKVNCQNNFNIYDNFTLKEFTWQNLFSMLKRYYHITSSSYGLFTYTNSVLDEIPTPREYRWRNEQTGLLEEVSPNFRQKRVDFKVKLLIKYLILNNLQPYIYRGWPDEEKIIKWKEYLNEVLNSDIENEESKVINGEDFYVNFLNNTDEDLTPDQSKLLTNIIYVENILKPLLYTYTERGEIRQDNKDIQLKVFKYIIDKYFITINQRSSISYYKNNYLIPNDFEILDMDSFIETTMNEWLNEDPTNLIFLYNSVQSDAINGIKGVGLTKNALYQLYAKLIVECKKSNIGLGVYLNDVYLDKIYNVLTVGDSLNNGILLSKLNCVKDEIEKENGNRIFYLTKEKLLKSIAGLSSVVFYNRYDLNIHGSYRNLVSAVHCGEGQETRVYDEIFIIDKNKLVSRSEFDRVLATGIIDNNITETESSAYIEISSRITNFINRPNVSSFELLMDSIRDNNMDIATEIIGGNDTNFLNNQDEYGNTPLIFAVDLGVENTSKLVLLLLEKNVNVNIQNKFGMTAIMLASDNFDFKYIKLLLKNKADIKLVDNKGNTALHLLAYSYNKLDNKDLSYRKLVSVKTCLDMLINNSPEIINVQNNKGETFLIVISKNVRLEDISTDAIKDILKYNPDPNIQDNDGYTALMYLVKNGNFEGTKQLLENGKDVKINLVNKYGDTALNFALFYGFNGIVKLLLDRPDIDLNIKDNKGLTPLHHVISAPISSSMNTIEYMVDRGANINTEDNEGNTPLITAIYEKNYQVITYLLRKGADMTLKNKNGITPLDIAIQEGIDVYRILSNLEEQKNDIDRILSNLEEEKNDTYIQESKEESEEENKEEEGEEEGDEESKEEEGEEEGKEESKEEVGEEEGDEESKEEEGQQERIGRIGLWRRSRR